MTLMADSPAQAGASVQTMTMAGALNMALADAMQADANVLMFGEDVGPLGGVFRVTDGLHERFGGDRCFDTPLAESGIVGVAIGMAMGGMIPVVEMQFDAFAYPAFEQITSHIAKLANRTRRGVSMPIVIRVPFGGGIGGVEHHCDSSEAYYAHTPGLTVVCPSTPQDAYSLMRAAIEHPDPVVFLEPKKLYWSKGEVDVTRRVDIGQASIARHGRDVTVVTYGSSVEIALGAAEIADAEGRSVQVIDVRTLNPIDDEAIFSAVRSTGRVVVMAEASGYASVASELAARIGEHCFESLAAPVRRVTGFDLPYAPPMYEHLTLPDVDRLLDAIDALHWEQ